LAEYINKVPSAAPVASDPPPAVNAIHLTSALKLCNKKKNDNALRPLDHSVSSLVEGKIGVRVFEPTTNNSDTRVDPILNNALTTSCMRD
jgi:hypothetical protein